MRISSCGDRLARSKRVWPTWEVSRRPWPVPRLGAGAAGAIDLAAASADPMGADDSAAGGAASARRSRSVPTPLADSDRRTTGGAHCGTADTRSRNTATPITPTSSGRPVRLA